MADVWERRWQMDCMSQVGPGGQTTELPTFVAVQVVLTDRLVSLLVLGEHLRQAQATSVIQQSQLH